MPLTAHCSAAPVLALILQQIVPKCLMLLVVQALLHVDKMTKVQSLPAVQT